MTMRCDEFDELVSLDLSDELGPTRRIEFERHLRGCAACTSLLERHRRVDELLRASLTATPVRAAAVQARVRERIQAEPTWRRIFELRALRPILAAAMLAIVIAILFVAHPVTDSRAYLLETAAADHVEDITLQIEKPGWMAGEREIESMAVSWVGDARALGSFAAEGYTLVKAKPCPLEGKSEMWLHLIYTRGGRDVSLFVRNRRISAASRGQLALAPDLSSSRVGDLEVVGLQRGDYGIVLVADVSRDEARRLADAAADWIASNPA
jgi:anti-sigma factor RsiW